MKIACAACRQEYDYQEFRSSVKSMGYYIGVCNPCFERKEPGKYGEILVYSDFRDNQCSLCRQDQLAPQLYSDNVFWETVCPVHGQPMVVLNHHTANPSPLELEHIRKVVEKRHPGKKLRGYMQSMPQHWHEHLI